MNKSNIIFILVDILILLKIKDFPSINDLDSAQEKILNLLVFFVTKNQENKILLV
jgi:hypothetical protein